MKEAKPTNFEIRKSQWIIIKIRIMILHRELGLTEKVEKTEVFLQNFLYLKWLTRAYMCLCIQQNPSDCTLKFCAF